jgi:hypothetical protein
MTIIMKAALAGPFGGGPALVPNWLHSLGIQLGFCGRSKHSAAPFLGLDAPTFVLVLLRSALSQAGRLRDAVAARTKAVSGSLIERVSSFGASLIWGGRPETEPPKPHSSVEPRGPHSLALLPELEIPADLAVTHVNVVFANTTYEALTRIAERKNGELAEALRKSILLTDFLDAQTLSGARIFIDRGTSAQEVIIR